MGCKQMKGGGILFGLLLSCLNWDISSLFSCLNLHHCLPGFSDSRTCTGISLDLLCRQFFKQRNTILLLQRVKGILRVIEYLSNGGNILLCRMNNMQRFIPYYVVNIINNTACLEITNSRCDMLLIFKMCWQREIIDILA